MKRVMPKVGKPIKFRKTEDLYLKCPGNGPYTKEFELWFQKIIRCVMGNMDCERFYALQSIQWDPNVPFMTKEFANFIAEQTTYFVIHPNLKILTNLMKMLNRLIQNQYVHNMKESLHQVLPACVTCIVCTTISSRPEVEDHFLLRNYASETLKLICDKYSTPTNRVKERVVALLRDAIFDPRKEFSTIYGTLYALSLITGTGIREWLPQIMKIDARVRLYSKTATSTTDKDVLNAKRIQQLISKIIQPFQITAKSVPNSFSLHNKRKSSLISEETPLRGLGGGSGNCGLIRENVGLLKSRMLGSESLSFGGG